MIFGQNISSIALESFSSILWGYSVANAGKGLYELKSRFSFFKHIVFSLLKGRTVVVYGNSQFRR